METLVLFVLLVLSLGGVWTFFDAARVRDAHHVGVGPGGQPPHRWAALTVLTLLVAVRWYLAARAEATEEPERTGPPPRFETGGLQTFAFVVAAAGLGVFAACLVLGEPRASMLGLLMIALGWFGGREVRDTGRPDTFELPSSAGWEQVGFVAPENQMDEEEEEPLLDLDRVAARRGQVAAPTPTGLPTASPRGPAPAPPPGTRPQAPRPTQPQPTRPRQPPPPPPGRPAQSPPPPASDAARQAPWQPPVATPTASDDDDVVDLHSLLGSAPSDGDASPPPSTPRPRTAPATPDPPPPPTRARTNGIEFVLDDRSVERTARGPAPRPETRRPATPSPAPAPSPQAPTRQAPAQQAPPRQAPPRQAPPPQASPPQAPARQAPPRQAPPRQAPPRQTSPRQTSPHPTTPSRPTPGPIPMPPSRPQPNTSATGRVALAASASRRGVPLPFLLGAVVVVALAGLAWVFWPRDGAVDPAPVDSATVGPGTVGASTVGPGTVDPGTVRSGTDDLPTAEVAATGESPADPLSSNEPLPVESESDQLSAELQAAMKSWAADYRRLFDPIADHIEEVDFSGFDDASCYALRDALGGARSALPEAPDDAIRADVPEALTAFDRAAAACLEREVARWSESVLAGKARTHAVQVALMERYGEEGLLELELESALGETRSRGSMTGRFLAQKELDF